ncbi:choice-of-anchor G family protein [Corynebacterium sp. YIM 101645]|uniref:Choice-of-anchor G family protein n=1 Tax=Corynebacterium lemuris TaxID=1859292 RepID=A0ABT2G081_9CORY|nr:choice-of-anchor G family protein [Corynebacterium lemuris]MCS5480893.1 choice-of-anchor G family protein [Corynebacterium lemuris]
MIGTANAQDTQAAYVSLADGTLIDLSLLGPFVDQDSETAFNSLLTAVTAERSWPQDQAAPEQTSRLDVTLLQGIRLTIAGISLPLVDTGDERGLLDLGSPGLGVLSAYAATPDANNAHAAAGVLGQDGFINVDAHQGSGNIQTEIQLTRFLQQLGISGLTDQVVDDLALRLGAVSSSAQETSGTVTAEYAIANAELNLHSPLLGQIGSSFRPGGVGADLDEAVEAVAGDGALVNRILGVVNGVLGRLGVLSALTDGPVTIDTDLETTLNELLAEPLYNGTSPETSLVVLNPASGDLTVNLEYLHGGNLSNLPANTELLTAAQINQIVAAVNGLLSGPDGLTARIQATVEEGLLATDIRIPLRINLLPTILDDGLELATVTIDGTLGDILNGTRGVVSGDLLGGTIPLNSILDTVVGALGGVGNLLRPALTAPTTSIINAVLTDTSTLVSGLDPVLRGVLGEVLNVTINAQPNELAPNDQALVGRPNAVAGTPANPAEDFSITAIEVDLLSLGGGAGLVSLPLARSTVVAADEAYVGELAMEPTEGPRAGGTTVTISGTTRGFTDENNASREIDAIYMADYRITDFIFDEGAGTVTFDTPAWELLDVEGSTVPVTLASGDVRSEELRFTYTGIPEADRNDPGYDWLTIRGGETKIVEQTWDTELPGGTTYSIDPRWRGLSNDWDISVDRSSGALSVTAPDDAPVGLVFEVPVIVTYPDGSVDRAPARVNVVTVPFGVEDIVIHETHTTVYFTDGTSIDIPHGEDGTDGVDGEDGVDGDSVTITNTYTDENGNTVIEFSDGSIITVNKGADGDDGTSVTITNTYTDENGNTVVEFSDGSTLTVQKGDKGDTGEDGESITIVSQVADGEGNIVITFSDGTVITVPKGVDGESVTIVSQTRDEQGNITLTFSDGEVVVIPAGADGDDGDSITIVRSELNSNGDLVIEFSDGTEVTVPKGVDGEDGTSVTITNTYTDENGNTVIEFSDGSTVTVQKGDKGDSGESITIVSQVPDAGGNIVLTFSDGTVVTVPKGATGDAGASITIVGQDTDAQGNVVLTFSDGSVVVIPKGVQGEQGNDGDSITIVRSELNSNGDLVIEFSDGNSVVVPKGADGEDGQDGDSVTISQTYTDENGNTVIEFSDGSTVTIAKGDKGDPGEDGEDGTSLTISETYTDENGNTVIEFSDGSTVTINKGVDGEDGESITIVSQVRDEQGNITLTFSDDSVVVIPAGVAGADGNDGASVIITDSFLNDDGDLVIEFSDGTEVTVPKGASGEDGQDGDSVTISETYTDENGNTVIEFSDGSIVTVQKGDKGDKGDKGEDGTSLTITDSYTDENGNTVIEFSDGTEVTINKGVDGEDGESVTIVNQTRDEQGNITLTFSDGEVVVIPAGADGDDGDSITIVRSELNSNGDLVIEFSDGTEVTVPKGVDGEDGTSVTITNTYTDENGNTVIEFSDGSIVTVQKGDKGDKGDKGEDGQDGETPRIGDNGNWWIGETDTGVKAEGEDGQNGVNGQAPYIKDGTWWVGVTPYVNELTDTWWIGDEETAIPATLADGAPSLPPVAINGTWWIGADDTGIATHVDTGIPATGPKGDDGKDGEDGKDGSFPGSSSGGGFGSSLSAIGRCVANPEGAILPMLALLGAAAAVNSPTAKPLADEIAAQINQQVANASSAAGQPEWLRQINHGLAEAAKSVDMRVVVPALIGAGILAVFLSATDCGPNQSSIDGRLDI